MKPFPRSPKALSGFLVFLTFVLVWCLHLSGASHAAPCITISKKSGPPTSQILVSGRGFEPNVGVDIYFDTKDEALVVTNGKGEFKDAKAYAPRSARPGQHWVTALERNNDKGAQKPFLVQTDWPQFHFTADGTRLNPYENVLNPRNVRRLSLRWTYNTGNVVYSSPAIADGALYVGSYDLFALDANTGAKLWSYNASTSTASPAVANGVVYSDSTDGNFYALDARTGARLWSFNTGSDDFSSPAVANGVVYVGSGRTNNNNLYALNAQTGAKLWSYTAGSYVDSSPTVVDGVVYFVSEDFNVYALNAKTGVKLWNYTMDSGVAVATGPAVANGVVYVGSWTGTLYALNAENGAELWSFNACTACAFDSPAIANGVVYITGGAVYALDAYTGAELWSYSPGGPVASSPAVANGVVYVGGGYPADDNLYALDARTGERLWSYLTSGFVASSPSVVNGVVYVGSWNDTVYAFSLPDGGQTQQQGARPPGFSALHPDLSLKASRPVAMHRGSRGE